MNALEVRGLSKVYKKKIHALRDLDLTVEQGTVFGLLGQNGAGKTTLIKILLGLRRPSGGEARVLDRPVGDTSARAQVGYLPEDHRLPPYLTGRRALDIYTMLHGHNPREHRARADELLDRLDLLGRAGDKIRGYSKGMKQRLGLAQAILHRPKLIFLDEPTDGVDPAGRKVIRDIITEEHKRGATVFINSHLLHEIEMICERVAILHEGELVQQGSMAELTKDPALTQKQVTFTFAGLPPALTGLPPGTNEVRRTEDAIVFGVDDEKLIDALIDHLRAGGAGIRGIGSEKIDLETHFLKIVAARAN